MCLPLLASGALKGRRGSISLCHPGQQAGVYGEGETHIGIRLAIIAMPILRGLPMRIDPIRENVQNQTNGLLVFFVW